MSGYPQSSAASISSRLGFLAGLTAILLGGSQIKPSSPPAVPDAPAAATLTAQAAAIDKDKLRIAIRLPNDTGAEVQGNLHAELIGSDGKVIASAEKKVRQAGKLGTHEIDFSAPQLPVDQLTLRGSFARQRFDVPLKSIFLPKGHETDLAASQEFHAGSTAVLRCEVHGVKSVTETVPLADAKVVIYFVISQEKGQKKIIESIPLYSGTSGSDGSTIAEFKVPDVPPGKYALKALTESALGEETLTREIQVKEGTKVLLTTDKPLYQPGQLIHIRALALRPFDLTPVGNTGLVFEVEDPKGNKVFKRAQQTSEFGVASLDFQLADEVNLGDYHVRAILGEYRSEKSVTVEHYVLPKFRTEVKTDRSFYLPKQTVHAEVQTDYFFGKPVAKGKVKVTASTFDVRFQDFQTWEGRTDANGHTKFEIKLPDSFVGQPLQKGNALVKLEIKVTDTADHTETLTKTYPVSDQPIRVSLIPEGGRLVPNLENRVFAAANYPDGTPAVCDVSLWLGRQADGKAFSTIKTNEAGLAEFRLAPRPEQLRPGPVAQYQVEMLGQVQTVLSPGAFLDLFAEARDAEGNVARARSEIHADRFDNNVFLRLDRAIYRSGDSMNVDVYTSAGLPTVYLDVIKSGQTMLTTWLDVKDGKAARRIDLPASLFGTLEIHAYQMMASGEIQRDSRVVYVQPRGDLKIDVKTDQAEYLPGGRGVIRFQVTDAAGKPTVAALGVIIVDEVVYALQDLQPGLEKVYFTLQEELLKPQVQVVYQPAESINRLVRRRRLPADKQQVAEVLLTAVKPKPPARWVVAPIVARREKAAAQAQQIGQGLYAYAESGQVYQEYDPDAKAWRFKPTLLHEAARAGNLNPAFLTDPFDRPLSVEDLPKIEPGFTPDHLARTISRNRMHEVYCAVVFHTIVDRAKYFKDGRWEFPDTVLDEAIKAWGRDSKWLSDGWGKRLKLVKHDRKLANPLGQPQFDYCELVSAGPDGNFDTDDDVRSSDQVTWALLGGSWWTTDPARIPRSAVTDSGALVQRRLAEREARRRLAEMCARPMDRLPARGRPGRAPAPKDAARVAGQARGKPGQGGVGKQSVPSSEPPTHVRDYFPETMLWDPALITDDKGMATLPVDFADSITTWRLSASASSKGGGLGSVSAPLRVFQEFFVDLDLPIALTQNDEIAFPVAVYNYLKTPQTVKLELERGDWFDLADENGFVRSLDLKPSEVTSVKFRIRAGKIGSHPLIVKATGSKRSDAIKRFIDVAPNGKRMEQVVTDRLSGHVTQTITIPDYALADSSKLTVKVYPGVMSQVLEGTEGMLRMPCGCFEQTSSSAYPNIMVVDYVKQARLASPQLLLKAEQYLNVGYQRLLTFERPGGGFDWWGSGPPLVWLSAYGLQEFNDMARVYPIDRSVIARTQKWLMSQRGPDATWSNIGATHSETIASMGNAKLLLTSYVVWALVDSGMRGNEMKQSIDYIRAHVDDAGDNAYILALAANALAAWDSKDDSTLLVLQKLDRLHQDVPDWKAICYPSRGTSLTYARGDHVTIETTALTALAMIRTGQFINSSSRALTYLIKVKQGNGTWGSTSATILSLKALVAGARSGPQKGKAAFTIKVNGQQAARGEVTEENADVMQVFDDFKKFARPGQNTIDIEVNRETSLMYQIVGRYYEPWSRQPPPAKPTLDVSVDYDRTSLSTKDLLRAKATLKYHGELPTYMVIVDLGIPPGFTVDAGDFAELVGQKKVQKYSVTSRQVILYLGDVKPGDVKTFEYSLRPKYPIKGRTPASVAYEYNAPEHRAEARPVELIVAEKQ